MPPLPNYTKVRRPPCRQRGFILVLLLALLAMGFLYAIVSQLNPEDFKAARTGDTADALAQAKAALIGYAATYGDTHANQVFGYLPLPDLGSSRNNNIGCPAEGCAASNFAGNTKNLSAIGRLPWRKLGLPPLRDGYGECLWYAVSGSFQSQQKADVLNWDSLGHLDVATSDGTPAGTASTVGDNYAQRPIAVVFSAGPLLPGQDRSASSTDDVNECGGNYDVRNYLDTFDTNAGINGIVSYFAGAANNATGYAYNLTSTADGSQLSAIDLAAPKPVLSGNIAVAGTLVANDTVLVLTASDIFDQIVRRSDFSSRIGALLDDPDLRAQVETGHPGTTPVSGAGTKGADNIKCKLITSAANQAFCSNWKEMLLLTQLPSPAPILIDGSVTPSCNRVLIFGGRRTTGQVRLTSVDKSSPANYLEGTNLSAFNVPTANSPAFSGSSTFKSTAASADVIRCLP